MENEPFYGAFSITCYIPCFNNQHWHGKCILEKKLRADRMKKDRLG